MSNKYNNPKCPNFLQAAIDRKTPGRHKLENFQFYSQFAEPGYTDPESGVIVLGDYNKVARHDQVDCDLPERVSKILEDRYGADCHWEDEWCSCGHCGKLVRTQPDSYEWKAYFTIEDGELTCGDCIAKDPEDYLLSLEGEEKKCVTFDNIDPAAYGYVKVLDKQENGFHEGQAADPKVIVRSLREKGVSRFLFVLDHASQFFSTFSCWIHRDELRIDCEHKWSSSAHYIRSCKLCKRVENTWDGAVVAEGYRCRDLGEITTDAAILAQLNSSRKGSPRLPGASLRREL